MRIPSPVPKWVAPTFGALAAVTVLWTTYLAATLPQHVHTRHYRLAWVGFDVGLTFALLATAYLAYKGNRHTGIAAVVTATLLAVDAWFDVVTSPRADVMGAVLSAVFAELPLAVVCVWIALHVDRVIARRMRQLAKRALREQSPADAE